MVRAGVTEWGVILLVDTRSVTPLVAGACMFWFEIGGTLGGFAAGYCSDKIFNGSRGPVNILFMIGLGFTVL
jgi:sugar phosphate permease